MMLTLTIEDDQGRKTDIPVTGQALTIGRAKENQLRLNERNVSRKHAKLSLQNGGVLIEDLDSYNGIRINGDRISGQTPLFLGDRIQLGDFFLQVHGETLRPRPEEITQKTMIPKKPAADGHHSDEVTNTEPMIVAPLNTGPQAQMKDPSPPSPTSGAQQQQKARREDSFDESTALIRLTDLNPQRNAASAQALSGPNPKLVCVKGPMAGKEWAVTKSEVVIGRGQENDVCIDHRSMSRAHAKLVLSGQTYRIVDMGSANGTLVNGEQYAQVDLKKGDTIELGHVKLRLVWPGETTPTIDTGPDTAFDESTEISNRPRQSPRTVEMDKSQVPQIPAQGSNKNLLIALSVGGGVLVVALVLVFAFSGEKPPAPLVTNQVIVPDNPPTAANTPPPAQPQPERKSNAPEVLRRANQEMANENWDQAVRILELGLDAENGNADLKAALDKAENESKAKMIFDTAMGSFQRGDYVNAKEQFQQVPDDSVYHQRSAKKLLDPKLKNPKTTPIVVAEKKQPDPPKEAKEKETKKKDPVEKQTATPPPVEKAAPKEKDPPKEDANPAEPKLSPREQAKKLFDQGNKSLMQNRLKEAIEYYLEATRTDPKYALPHRGLGIAHARAGNGDAAVEHYRLYLQLFPSAPDAEQVKKIINEYETGD